MRLDRPPLFLGARSLLSLSKPLNLPDSSKRYFTDVDSESRYYEAVNSLAERQITRGFTDGSFGPRLNITRAEFSVFLSKTLANGIIGIIVQIQQVNFFKLNRKVD